MLLKTGRRARPLALVLAVLMLVPLPAMAVDITGDLLVTVQSAADEKPVAGAEVTVQDQDHARAPVTETTDADGKAAFQQLLIGGYSVTITQKGFETDKALVTVTSGSAATYKSYLDVAGGEKVIKVKESTILVNPNDPHQPSQTRDSDFIENQISNGGDLQSVLSTNPGVNTDSLGQVHVRGEHKSVSLSVDGIDVPEPAESVATQLIDPRFLDQLSVIEGGYDASEGGQLGAIFNFVTKVGPETPYVDFIPSFGTNGISDELIRAGGSNTDGTLNYFVGASNQHTDLFTEAPNPTYQSNNNTNTAQNYIVRLTKHDDKNTYGLTIDSVNGIFGTPENPQDAAVQQFEHDTNDLYVLSWNHKFNDRDNLLFGYSFLKATETYANNGAFTPFVQGDAQFEQAAVSTIGNLLPANPENPGSPYLPNTNLEIDQTQPSLQFHRHFGENDDLKLGVTFDQIYSGQAVNISIPGAANSNLGSGQQLLENVEAGALLPGGAHTSLVDGVPTFNSFLGRHGETESAYFSRTQPIGKKVIINYGLRADRYNDGISVDQSQLSPLINGTYITSDTSAFRLSYNRLFQPPPLELDPSGNSEVVPQRTSAYEASYEWQPNQHTVANVSAVYKDYTNQVDVALLIPSSNLPLFAPVNFDHGFYKGIDAGITSKYNYGVNYFLSTTYSEARPTEAGPFDPILPDFNDHDQRLQVTGGLSNTFNSGTVAAFDFLYGSGYPLDSVSLYNSFGVFPFGLSGERISRFIANFNLTFNARNPKGSEDENSDSKSEKSKRASYGISVNNIFDDRSVVNFLSGFAGTRFIQGRTVVLHGNFRF